MTEEIIFIYIRGAGLIAAGGVFWFFYFDFKDALKPEPRGTLAMSCLLGAGAALLGLAAYHLLEWIGIEGPPGHGTLRIFIYCVFVVGVVEEGAKFFVARTIVFRWKHFDERIDGLVYAGAVAIGFASVENLIYTPYLEWPGQLARAVVSPLTHSLFAAIWGLGTAHAFFRTGTRAGRFIWQALPLAAAMLLHGLYDFALLAHEATFAAGGIILLLWIFMIWSAHRLVRADAAD